MFGHNAGVKEPSYKVLQKDGAYEVREYPRIVMITSYAEGNFKRSQSQSFEKLFDYISGKNAAKKDIPMTAPVIMESKGQEIPMTAPVLMSAEDKGWSMSFVLPDEYTLETAPQPMDTTLRLEERKNIKFAALRFNGLFSEENFLKYSNELANWIEGKNLKTVGSSMRAGYNPPWTLPPLRRNEILIPVE